MALIPASTDAPPLFVQTMTQVSNRTVVDRCKAWGCIELKTSGEWTYFHFPPTDRKFKVRSAYQHNANSKFDFQEMLTAMDLTWSEFMGADLSPEARAETLVKEQQIMAEQISRRFGDQIAQIEKEIKKEDRKSRKEERRRQRELEEQQMAAVAAKTAQADSNVMALVPAEQGPQRQRYINRVFDLLVEKGDAMSNSAVAEALGLTNAQAGSAMTSLYDQGVLDRIKPGVYQAKASVTKKDTHVGVVFSGDAPVRHTVPVAAPVTIRVQQDAPRDDEDATINEILDLIAPNGFKAKHLPLIDAFKAATLTLMREIEAG